MAFEDMHVPVSLIHLKYCKITYYDQVCEAYFHIIGRHSRDAA